MAGSIWGKVKQVSEILAPLGAHSVGAWWHNTMFSWFSYIAMRNKKQCVTKFKTLHNGFMVSHKILWKLYIQSG